LIGLLSTSSLLAQSFSATATAHNELTVIGESTPCNPVTATVPAGTPLANGFCITTWGTSAVLGNAQTCLTRSEDHAIARAHLMSVAETNTGSGLMAGTGLSQILYQVSAPPGVPLVVELTGRIGTCSGEPTGEVKIDIGNDGTNELALTAETFLDEVTEQIFVTAPTGTIDILISTELNSPMGSNGSFVFVDAIATVKPGHTTATDELSACGTWLKATPLLDFNVQFESWNEQPGDVCFLALGAARQQLPLPMPISMGCSLLITPDWVMPMQPMTPEFIPLVCMGAGEIFAQIATFRPQPPGSSQGDFLMSQRVALEVH